MARFTLAVAVCSLATAASAQPISMGRPQAGSLTGGTAVPANGDGFRFQTVRGNPEARYGTPELVRGILAAIASVNHAEPGGELVVEDLSHEHGGAIEGHGSHQSGRDVDLRYYATDAAGRPLAERNIEFNQRGHAVDGGPERFDVRRNWLLVAAMLGNDELDVVHIFIAPHLEALLLDHARTERSPLIARAARILKPPGSRLASPHADHLHVRIGCAARDRGHCR